MLDFLNWFFTFFLNFIDCLSRFPVEGTLSLSMIICSAMVFIVVGNYLIGQHYKKTLPPPDSKGGSK